jgi:UDP-N-acetylglucosamine 2-epimerase (non-hydrolysing)
LNLKIKEREGMERPIIIVIGTRPDAIKLISVYQALKKHGIPTLLCATNQHRELLDQVLQIFHVTPDVELRIMKDNQGLDHVTATVLQKATELFLTAKPQLVIVQGDTSSSFAAALAAYYQNIPIAHVEAGLRTWDARAPFPEEINRTFITRLASFHFAVTPLNVLNLTKDGVSPHHIFCVGNTVVDALFSIKERIDSGTISVNQNIRSIVEMCKQTGKKIVLLTTHRRESFGGGITRILQAVTHCAQKHPDVFIFFPVHPNPNVYKDMAQTKIDSQPNVFCCQPIIYTDLIYLLTASQFILTDSGGILEEAVSLGKHVLILREKTERVEAIWDGMSKLVGTNIEAITKLFDKWLEPNNPTLQRFTFGDGTTTQRIVDILIEQLHLETKTHRASFSSSKNPFISM